MSVHYILSDQTGETITTAYFVEHLRKKWPNAHVHFISDPKANSLLQWKVTTDDDGIILGDFSGTGISYTGGDISDIARIALWYRGIVPFERQLHFYNTPLSFHPMFLKRETTEEQIIAGFDIPFDLAKYDLT